MNKDTFYTLLDIPAHATSAEIDAAYQCQRDRYSAERVAALGDEFRAIAEARNAELDTPTRCCPMPNAAAPTMPAWIAHRQPGRRRSARVASAGANC